MNDKKIQAITEWKEPGSVKDIQCFLGFANFYRRFIKDYSKICKPLYGLIKKDTKYEFGEEARTAFNNLKTAFTTAPILRHYDPTQPCTIETDASDFVIAAIISQPDETGILHPVAFYSRKMLPAECNYEIYDKEMLAIVSAFKEWRSYLEGSPHQVKVLCDHKNLQYFMTTKALNRRQARWGEELSSYDFVITYRPGKQGGKPDALTRRSGDLPSEGDLRLTQQNQALLKPRNFENTSFNMGINNASSLQTSYNKEQTSAGALETSFTKGQTSAGALQSMNSVAASSIDSETTKNIQDIKEANLCDGERTTNQGPFNESNHSRPSRGENQIKRCRTWIMRHA